jgi:hypothetical protein
MSAFLIMPPFFLITPLPFKTSLKVTFPSPVKSGNDLSFLTLPPLAKFFLSIPRPLKDISPSIFYPSSFCLFSS